MPFNLPGSLLALLLIASPAGAASPNPLVGTWIMDEFVDYDADGKAFSAMGDKPVGMFIFTADGHFSFNMMRPPSVARADKVEPYQTLEPNWYMSYFGAYQFDPSGPGWTAQVHGGNVPSYIGTEQKRVFTICDGKLYISQSYTLGGKTYRADRVLHRAEAKD